MNAVRRGVEVILKHDPIIAGLVGQSTIDGTSALNVFELRVMPKFTPAPPYVVWVLIPGERPQGVYSDSNMMEIKNVQINCWGRDADEAWDLSEAVMYAFDTVRTIPEMAPYYLIFSQRNGDEQPLDDRMTGFVYVPLTYRLVMGR